MVGDGINDVLALKHADCSIALGSGSSAARQVAQIVLLNDDFSMISNIIFEGQRRNTRDFLKTVFEAYQNKK